MKRAASPLACPYSRPFLMFASRTVLAARLKYADRPIGPVADETIDAQIKYLLHLRTVVDGPG